MRWTIYCHTHIDSGRRYVGQTKEPWERRWSRHLYDARAGGTRFYFANALRKYGANAFAHSVLEVCESQELANEAEGAWIEAFSARDPAFGFNRKRGGNQGPHFVTKNPWDRAEYRDKMASVTGRFSDPSTQRPLMRASQESRRTPESRARRSAASKATHNTPEYLARASALSREIHARPGVREKLCRSARAKLTNETYLAKRAALPPRSAESRAKMAAAMKAKWADPEYHARRVAQMIECGQGKNFRPRKDRDATP